MVKISDVRISLGNSHLKYISPAEQGAFLAEPCNMVYSLFYVTKYFSILWTTQNPMADPGWGIWGKCPPPPQPFGGAIRTSSKYQGQDQFMSS